MRRILEIVANLGLVVVCSLFIWFAVANRSKLFHTASASTPTVVGKTLPEVERYSWNSHASTLVLALRKDCHFCEASMPFYQRLAAKQAGISKSSHLLLIAPDSQEEAASYFSQHGLAGDASFGQQLSDFYVSGTPTLMLVDSNGKVQQAWVGQLDAREESAVEAAVLSLPKGD